MKKRYLVLTLVGLLLGYQAKTEHWFEDEREIYFPITKEQLRANAKVSRFTRPHFVLKGETDTPTENSYSSTDLEKINRSVLSSELYVNKVLEQTQNQALYFDMIRKRFSVDYNKSGKENISRMEANDRLQLLKAVGHFWSDASKLKYISPHQLESLFLQISKNSNEDLVVRRQAYVNWLALKNEASEDSKAMTRENKKRLRNLVAFSDENLLNNLSRQTEN